MGMPLCFREVGASDLDFINEQCGDCNDFSATPTCNKWEKLEDCYEDGDAFKVTGVEICTDICGPVVPRGNEYCSSLGSGAYLFNYENFVQSEEDAKKYLEAENIEKKEADWKNDWSYEGEIDTEYLNTSPVLFVDRQSANLNDKFTLGKLVERLLKKSSAEYETFWVDLENQIFYCYHPCPAMGDCCWTTKPGSILDFKISTSIRKYPHWHTWVNKNISEFTLVQNYKLPKNEDLYCGVISKVDTTKFRFWRENCRAEHKPLCMKEMKDDMIQITDTTRRKRKNKDKKKTRNSKKKKAGKGSSRRQ